MHIELSANFKKMTSKAIFAIITFILVYLVLLAAGIALTILCIYGGISLIIAVPKLMIIILGAGIASFGIIILIFLIKFLFKQHTVNMSHLVEISREEYPKLFDLIEEIAKEAETKFPKKVYLANDVNAAVFYNSSFWSMFFPIRKNLQIGMGLVNTVTEQELKAILAHEFGHFSQRSMSVGSYVYNVNQVIFNMLYDNESFDDMIRAWASISGYFSIFVMVAVKVIQGIQWILQKMYGFVNLRYMALSREMEFHADEVAANIAGSKPLEESLLRLDISQQAFSWAVNFYENKADKNIISKNIYKNQSFALSVIARENKIPLKNGLPQVSILDTNKYKQSRINIKDQWASHPSTEERVVALQRLSIVKDENKTTPAISLFPDAEKIEEELTKTVFYNLAFRKDTIVMDSKTFEKELSEEVGKNKFPDQYNDYYDNKDPLPFDLSSITNFNLSETMDTLFSKEKVNTVYKYNALGHDKNILEAINRKEIKIKTFEYDGQMYRSKQAKDLIDQLEKERIDTKNQIAENDVNIYKYFYNQASKKGNESELKGKYQAFFEQDTLCEKRISLYNEFVRVANQLSMASQEEQVENIFSEISKLEINLKAELKNLMENPDLEKEMTKPVKDNFDIYLSKIWRYSANPDSDNEYLDTLFTAVNNFNILGSRAYFLAKLDILKYQIEQL